jgi:neutral trehalase
MVQGRKCSPKKVYGSPNSELNRDLSAGGHAFPTEGLLLGPILEEFKNKRSELSAEMYELCNAAIAQKGGPVFAAQPVMRITVQGGIGTTSENDFLMEHYVLDGTGWEAPFCWYPRQPMLRRKHLHRLVKARRRYDVSYASPLGIAFSNFKSSTAEIQRHDRIEKQAGQPML